MSDVMQRGAVTVRESEQTIRGPRGDIQGLRAIAVLAVVANHLWGWPAGGFVGVDVFFVVSGFLISDLLVRERTSKGRIDFADFYRRRVRRIIPAAALVIASTVVATYWIVGSTRGGQVFGDGVWALFFGANWHMAAAGTDYFGNNLVSPLQHYWSLSVEEQFYFIWPTVILATFALANGRKHTHVVLFAVMAALVSASFTYSLWHTQSQPTWAYFSTFDRAWELGLGATLAVAKPTLAKTPAVLAGFLGWLGLAGIATSFFVIRPESGFPAPWAALPVIATGMVIAAGVGHRQRHLFPLVNPLARYVGDLSYSLYLWHFPVVILALSFFPDRGVSYALWCVTTMGVLTVISFHLVEEPIRHSDWLEPGRPKRVSGSGYSRLQKQWLGVLTVAVAILTAMALQPPIPPATTTVARELSKTNSEQTLTEQQSERVVASLEMTAFPRDFSPAVNELGFDKWFAQRSESGCIDITEANLGDCAFGDADAQRLAVVYGDSFAMAWMPSVVEALGSSGYRVQQVTYQQCPAWAVSVDKVDGSPHPTCDTWHDWSLTTIRALEPELVVMASQHGTIARLASGAEGPAAVDEAEAGLVQSIRDTGVDPSKVFVLAPPPLVGNLQECVTRVGVPEDCVGFIDDAWRQAQDAESRAAQQTGATYVDTNPWFCFTGRCPGFVGTTPVTVDGSHLTPEYAQELAPLLTEVLAGENSDSAR